MAKSIDKMSRNDLLVEVRVLRERRQRDFAIEMVQSVFGLLKLGIQWVGSIGIAFFMWRTSDALAGKITLADIGINFSFLGGVKLNVATSWGLATGFFTLWLKERALRKSVIAKEHQDRARLERLIDPKRTSSMLEPHGDNPPGEER